MSRLLSVLFVVLFSMIGSQQVFAQVKKLEKTQKNTVETGKKIEVETKETIPVEKTSEMPSKKEIEATKSNIKSIEGTKFAKQKAKIDKQLKKLKTKELALIAKKKAGDIAKAVFTKQMAKIAAKKLKIEDKRKKLINSLMKQN